MDHVKPLKFKKCTGVDGKITTTIVVVIMDFVNLPPSSWKFLMQEMKRMTEQRAYFQKSWRRVLVASTRLLLGI